MKVSVSAVTRFDTTVEVDLVYEYTSAVQPMLYHGYTLVGVYAEDMAYVGNITVNSSEMRHDGFVLL